MLDGNAITTESFGAIINIEGAFKKKMRDSLERFAAGAVMVFRNMKAMVKRTYKSMANQNLKGGCSGGTIGQFSYCG